jgi:hypothetical protein
VEENVIRTDVQSNGNGKRQRRPGTLPICRSEDRVQLEVKVCILLTYLLPTVDGGLKRGCFISRPQPKENGSPSLMNQIFYFVFESFVDDHATKMNLIADFI